MYISSSEHVRHVITKTVVFSTLLAILLFAGIQCVPLPDIPSGIIEYGPDTSANYMLGTTATYICNNGFFLDVSVGNEVRTCVDDDGLDDLGVFTGSQPTCVRKSIDNKQLLSVAIIVQACQ